MTIKSSGQLTFTEIHDEFASLGSNFGQKPYTLSEYRTLPAGVGLPQSGEIKFSDFYGKSNIIFVEASEWIAISDTQIASQYNIKECNLWTALQAMGYTDPTRLYDITIPANYWLWSDDVAVGGLTIPSDMTGNIWLRNNGNIIGKGGKGGSSPTGSGQNGGPALVIENTQTPIQIINGAGAYIAAGGGGGEANYGAGGGGAGGGGGGGGGGTQRNGAAGRGGAILSAGTNGGAGSGAQGGRGGGSGGGGGGADTDGSICKDNGSGGGGGGGRILPGVGGIAVASQDGNGGKGGDANSNGSRGSNANGGDGGGGWGADGASRSTSGSGGSGGRAIAKEATSTNVITINSGNIWGKA